MQQILTTQQLQRLDMEISQTPLRKELLYILDNIEQATQEMLESIPLYSLIYLQYLAQSKNLNKATQIITKGNRNESTSTAKGAESGAQSRESGAISQTSKDTEAIYRKSLECTELEKAEFNRLFLAFLKLNKEIETNLEKKYNDNIDKIIKEHNAKKQYVYATQLGHFTQETMKKIRKEVFFLESYGYEISPQNTKAIKNLLELGQDKAMKM